MRRVPIDEAQVGDVLAEPPADAQGKTLLPKGARLSMAGLSLLRRRGVFEVCVEGGGGSGSGTPALLEALEIRFAGLEDDPIMMELKSVARGHLLRRR